MKIFGMFKGMIYGDCGEDFEAYKKYKNEVDKSAVIKHIESLRPAIAPAENKDIFTGKRIAAGMYDDGEYRFPTDFLHYYKNYNIGIPYDYEEYLKSINAV